MVIPDEAFWSALASLGGVMGWLVALEKRLNARLTRKEHSEICDKANGELSKRLDKIQGTLEKQGESALLHRQLVGDSLAEIRTTVAVLQDRERQGRRGDHPNEPGPHLRRI